MLEESKVRGKTMWLIKKIWTTSISLVEKMEKANIGFGAWFFSIFSFIILRNFLEALSSRNDYLSNLSWPFVFLHTVSFYFLAILTFIVIINFLTGEKIEKISKASVLMAPLLLLAPIIDLVVFKGKNSPMLYVDIGVNSIGEIFRKLIDFIFFGPNGLLQFLEYFTTLGSIWESDAIWNSNYGIKMELGLIVIIAAIYVYIKTSSVIKTLALMFFSRIIIFFLVYFPSLSSLFFREPPDRCGFRGDFAQLNRDFSWNFVMFSLYFSVIIFFSAIWFWRYDKKKFLALIENIRTERLMLYIGAFIYGLYLASPNFKFNFSDMMVLLLAVLAIIFSWLFAVGSNDLADEMGDEISKPYRPLPSGKMTHEEVRSLNIVFRVISYVCAFAAGYTFFITILVRSCISYLYSNNPFRLKKFPIISTFCIACGVLLGILGGFLLFADKEIFDFPISTAFFILTFFTLGMNFIHINDREGDKKENVWTIPVIFGERLGKLISAIFLSAAILSAPIFYDEMPRIIKLSFAGLSVLAFLLVNKKRFKEWQVIALCAIVAFLVILFTERPLWGLL